MFANIKPSALGTLVVFAFFRHHPAHRDSRRTAAQSGIPAARNARNHIDPDLLRPEEVAGAVGIISTYAGNGYGAGRRGFGGYSGDGGPATAAELNQPAGIVMDSQGNLFIADTINNRIRRVDHAYHPHHHHRRGIRLEVPTAETSAAKRAMNVAMAVQPPAPLPVLSTKASPEIDSSDNLYIADYGNNAIRKVTASTGVISTIAGLGLIHQGFTGDGAKATLAELNGPYGVAVDAAGNVYIAKIPAATGVRKITASTGIITTVAGGGSSCAAQHRHARRTAAPALTRPSPLPPESRSTPPGNIYITDLGNDSLIRVVNAKTQIITIFAGNTSDQTCTAETDGAGDGCVATSALLYNPQGIAFDATGDLYLSDSADERVRRIDAKTHIITTVAGDGIGGFTGTGGPATGAEINDPYGIAFDSSGNLYFADLFNQVVRKVTYPSTVATPR